MSEFFDAFILAIVQGITEWLPVSSSGHLALVSEFLNYEGGLYFDVALHFGTLMAVFVYFGKDITDILQELFRGRFRSQNGRLGLLVLLATIPAGVVGFLLKDVFESVFSNLLVVGFGFAITGLLLMIASMELRPRRKVGVSSSLVMGFAQIFALFPGISRAGSTLSSGLIFGLDEKDALKFSFLMSIPIIFGANVLVIGSEKIPPTLFWATLVSFVVGLVVLHLLYKYILVERKNLKWFGAYALILSVAVLSYVFFVQ